jgi:hypothetical protein
MANVPQQPILQTDLQDPALTALNDQLRRMVTEINRLGGYAGNVQINNNIDLQGKYKILNAAP